jgi:hypothetical protein
MTSVVRELEWPASRAISSTGTPEADEAGPQLAGSPTLPDAGGLADGPEGPADVGRVQFGADRGGEDQVVLAPQVPGSRLLLVLPHVMRPQRFDDGLG